ncbi:TOM1-like protein 2 isoform X2 [Crassostrea angulata]|uniref:TOM1-like protein 2 isoform X2 n=1 Tax=Magallana angulata TaxID=2784310 RepID=UPI0022B20737|nr:TOM1-like protein 2 isoform X2 [Crassostrea angulata]
MAALFGHGNPLATQVGQLIERGTDGSQASENWAILMEVCDIINETDEGPKDAARAIRKRLSQNMGKNHTAIMYTLTCLETCVKNCGRRFHIQLANKDFLSDLIKVIGPKYDPPQAVQEKVLSLIQTWADAFRGTPELKEIDKVYQDLKAKGIEFPMTDLDHLAPIYTPARSTAEVDPGLSRLRPSTRTAPVVPQTPPQPTTGPINPSAEQMTKLKTELNVVQGNIRVMSEMLTELTPTNIDPSDLELLQELNRTNRQMQQRLVELIDKIANEEATNELLRINDDMNNVFLRYERFERYRTGQSGQQPSQPSEPLPSESMSPPSYDQASSSPAPVSAQPAPTVGNLIDLGDDTFVPNPQLAPQVTAQMANLDIGSNSTATSGHNDDDFDMFAQSRKSFETNKQAMGSYANQQEDQFNKGGLGTVVNSRNNFTKEEDVLKLTREEEEVLKLQDKETDYDEMEQWLTAEQKASLNEHKNQQKDSLSSSEFDSFLADRAQAADTLPSIAAATGQRSRKLQKDDEENPLFAL